MSDHDVPPDDQRAGGETTMLPYLLLARQAMGECVRARATQRRAYGPALEATPYQVIDEAVHAIHEELFRRLDAFPKDQLWRPEALIIGQTLRTVMEMAPDEPEAGLAQFGFPPED